MRLVDADKEIEFYKGILYNPTPDVSESDRWHTNAIISAFERAATVESRPKGEWIDDIGMYRCSNCNHTEAVKRNYCSRCGTDMR